jgi:ELWxxDGT repeat protein
MAASCHALTPPTLVEDLNRVSSSTKSGGKAEIVNGKYLIPLYFPDFGRELAAIDENGISLLKDINPGPGDAPMVALPNYAGVYMGLYIFQVNASESEIQIWRSDATPRGTFLIKSIQIPQESDGSRRKPQITFAKLSDNKFYFTVKSSTSPSVGESRLYISDGTINGTIEVALEQSYAVKNPTPFSADGFFAAQSSSVGEALFRVFPDGSIKLIKDFSSTIISPKLGSLHNAGPRKYLGTISAGGNAPIPYTTDGTSEGTVTLNSVATQISNIGSVFPLQEINSKLYFQVRDREDQYSLWETDGTDLGTKLYYNFKPPSPLTVFGSAAALAQGLLFFARESASGDELWFAEPPPRSPQLIKDLLSGPKTRNIRYPDIINVNPDIAAFIGQADNLGTEVFITDGTAAGTKVLIDLELGEELGAIGQLQKVTDNKFFFQTYKPSGPVLYSSNGTTQGTKPMSNFGLGLTRDSNPDYIGSLITNRQIFFATTGLIDFSLVSYNEESGALSKIISSHSLVTAPVLEKSSNQLFVGFSTPDTGNELWRTDGSSDGTRIVKDIKPGPKSSDLVLGVELNGILLFWADDGIHGQELYRSDGTAEGTYLIKEFVAGNGSGYIPSFLKPSMIALNGKAIFFARNETAAVELWSSDGTTQGTFKIASSQDRSNNLQLVELNGYVYFPFYSADTGYELWRTNGLPEGTTLVADLVPGPSSSRPQGLSSAGNKIYFITQDQTSKLWVSDGSSTGTKILKESSRSPRNDILVKEFNSRAIFSWFDETHGFELWTSDGTENGTVLLKDINTGSLSSEPKNFVEFQQRLYFTATTASDGQELWTSDGTTDGTLQVDSIALGARSSGATPLYATKNTLFIIADDGRFGRELYVMTSQRDQCPSDTLKFFPGTCGCGVADIDSDSDSFLDCQDACISDPFKKEVGICGCGFQDTRSSTTGEVSCINQCPPGISCGCLKSSADKDRNGVADCDLRGEILKRMKNIKKILKKLTLNNSKKTKQDSKLASKGIKALRALTSYIKKNISSDIILKSKNITKPTRTIQKIVKKKTIQFTNQILVTLNKAVKKMEKVIKKKLPIIS